MSVWRIRAARPGDAPDLARLAGELGYPSPGPQIKGRFERIGSDRDPAVLVAEDNSGRIGGRVHVFINKLLESDPRAEIGGLVADPAMRRQGIGRALMPHAEDWTRRRGVEMVSLRSNIKRVDAHQFHEGIGYTVAKTPLNFRKQI